MRIRPATDDDHAAIWRILEPTLRAGETYAVSRDLTEAEALQYWRSPSHEVFVAEVEATGEVLGTYYLRPNQSGGGAHVCNCGYMTGAWAARRGVARAMCAHSLEHAKARGYRAMQFNMVVGTNTRAIQLWESFGFTIVGRLPEAFHHPRLGFVEGCVMYRKL